MENWKSPASKPLSCCVFKIQKPNKDDNFKIKTQREPAKNKSPNSKQLKKLSGGFYYQMPPTPPSFENKIPNGASHFYSFYSPPLFPSFQPPISLFSSFPNLPYSFPLSFSLSATATATGWLKSERGNGGSGEMCESDKGRVQEASCRVGGIDGRESHEQEKGCLGGPFQLV